MFSWFRIIWTRKGNNAVQHQNIVFHDLLKQIPWAIFEQLSIKHNADWDVHVVKTKAHLIAMLYGQFCGARGLQKLKPT